MQKEEPRVCREDTRENVELVWRDEYGGRFVQELWEPSSEACEAPWRRRHHCWALEVQEALARSGDRRRGERWRESQPV